MTNLSEELCKVCGIEGKWIEYKMETSDGCVNSGVKKIFPDFYEPENFVRLLELKILTGATLWGWLSAQGVFMAQRKNVLKTIYLILSEVVKFCDKSTLESIKQAIREADWIYPDLSSQSKINRLQIDISKKDIELSRCKTALADIEVQLNNFCNLCPNRRQEADYCNNGCFLDEISRTVEDIIDKTRWKVE